MRWLFALLALLTTTSQAFIPLIQSKRIMTTSLEAGVSRRTAWVGAVRLAGAGVLLAPNQAFAKNKAAPANIPPPPADPFKVRI